MFGEHQLIKDYGVGGYWLRGGGGSIGSELCRQICRFDPAELVLLGHDENPLFEMELELRERFPAAKISTVIADIKDGNRMEAVFQEAKPEVVFHAAAHKHVPLMEANPGEAFKNNVLGTRNVAFAADKAAAETFVLISTDKAVNPTSVMGATKRIAEILIQSFNEISTTKFVAVRFGNVLGSRGSVVPIFQEQIRRGGPVTVTDPEMRRFFMTIPEAAQLVLEAGGMAQKQEFNYREAEKLFQRLLQRQFCSDREAVFDLLCKLETTPEMTHGADKNTREYVS
jgi:FlaA1/EpsC-like NDP-sugar epimerase